MQIEAGKFSKFSLRLQQAYRDNPYHTAIHAADVLQNVYFYLIVGGAFEKCKTTTFDLVALYISAAAHDVDHPGHNNVFESKTKSKLATLYND
jgi:hypothetical protein